MKKFFRKYSDYLAAMGFAILIAGTVFFGVLGLRDKLYEIHLAVKERQMTQQLRWQRIDKNSRWEEDIEYIRQQGDLLDAFAGENDLVKVVRDLEAKAEKLRVKVSFEVPEEKSVVRIKNKKNEASEQEEEKPSQETLVLKAEGKFADVLAFLKAVENYRYVFETKNLSLKRFVRQENSFAGTGVVLSAPKPAREGVETEEENKVLLDLTMVFKLK